VTAANASRLPERQEIAIAVVEDHGKFLIGLRPDGSPLAGMWEFPGGKIETGESPAEAAARECLEETGLAVRILGQYPQAVHDYEHARVRLHFFSGAPLEARRTLPSRFRWVTRNELKDYVFPPANARLISLLCSG
jgi:mutator protein MutT